MFRGVLVFAVVGVLSLVASTVQGAPPVEAYGKLPALEKVSLSPSGQRLAMIRVAGETRTLVVTTLDNKFLFATSLETAKVREIRWAGDDHLIISLSSTVNLGVYSWVPS